MDLQSASPDGVIDGRDGMIANEQGSGISGVSASRWIGTWATAMTGPPPLDLPPFMPQMNVRALHDHRVRLVTRISASGRAIRIRFSNAFGDVPLHIGSAHVARALVSNGRADGRIIAATDRALTFEGRASATIAPGESVTSDAASFAAEPCDDIAVSFHIPEPTSISTLHMSAMQAGYVAKSGPLNADMLPDAEAIGFWPFLTGIDVLADEKARAVAILGDSISDGVTIEPGSNGRWPDVLSRRLRQTGRGPLSRIGILNSGISGNRLLHDSAPALGLMAGESAIRRLDRDVLDLPGVDYVVLAIGLNDLILPGVMADITETVVADAVIGGLRRIAERVRGCGLRVIGATLTPFAGSVVPGFFTADREYQRQSINDWIRHSAPFDAVIDFDLILRDPASPEKMRASFVCEDGIHPSMAGYAAIGDAVNLQIFDELAAKPYVVAADAGEIDGGTRATRN